MDPIPIFYGSILEILAILSNPTKKDALFEARLIEKY